MQDNKCVVDLFETLVDEKSLIPDSKREEINKRGDKSIGYSQFNEILLLLGFDRVSSSFFQYIVDGSIEYKEGAAIELMNNFQQGVERFIVLALLWYGNIKYAFKILSSNDSELEEKVLERIPWEEKHYKMRHPPVIEIETIPADKTYYVGYLMID